MTRLASDSGWRTRWRGRHGFASCPPDPPGAELAGEIFVGWRVWRAIGNPLHLASPSTGEVWPPGQALEARGSWPEGGVYAHVGRSSAQVLTELMFRELAGGVAVYGRVALWGNVRHRYGEVRADYGYPLTLDEVAGTTDWILHELRAVYLGG